MVIFVCLHFKPLHYHHYADVSDGIELLNICQVHYVMYVSKIKSILSIIFHVIHGAVCIQLTHFCNDCKNICTLSYYHHQSEV